MKAIIKIATLFVLAIMVFNLNISASAQNRTHYDLLFLFQAIFTPHLFKKTIIAIMQQYTLKTRTKPRV